MKWIANTGEACSPWIESSEVLKKEWAELRKGFVVGEPQASHGSPLSVADLKASGMIGLYEKKESEKNECSNS